MPVEPGDIRLRLSTQSGAAGNTTAATPAQSLGGFMSTTDVVTATMANVFSGVPLAVALPGGDIYRCVFLTHESGDSTWLAVRVWIASQLAGGGDVTIGLDPAGVVPAGDTNPQAAVIANETEPPAGVAFSNPTTEGDGLVVGDIGPGECAALWLRLRIPANPEAMSLDKMLLSAKGPSEL